LKGDAIAAADSAGSMGRTYMAEAIEKGTGTFWLKITDLTKYFNNISLS
jgi:hypothetical protein